MSNAQFVECLNQRSFNRDVRKKVQEEAKKRLNADYSTLTFEEISYDYAMYRIVTEINDGKVSNRYIETIT